MDYQQTEMYRYLIYLRKYLLGDLEKFQKLCKEAEEEEKEKSNSPVNEEIVSYTKFPYSFEFIHGDPVIARSTIPHPVTLFATIDLLGFLTRNGSNYAKTVENFKSFFSSISQPINQIEIEVLVKVYRHGTIHSYFPKLNMEISCHSKNPSNKVFFKGSTGDLVLNVNYLLSIVEERLDDIIDDSSLYPNMEAQYNLCE